MHIIQKSEIFYFCEREKNCRTPRYNKDRHQLRELKWDKLSRRIYYCYQRQFKVTTYLWNDEWKRGIYFHNSIFLFLYLCLFPQIKYCVFFCKYYQFVIWIMWKHNSSSVCGGTNIRYLDLTHLWLINTMYFQGHSCLFIHTFCFYRHLLGSTLVRIFIVTKKWSLLFCLITCWHSWSDCRKITH